MTATVRLALFYLAQTKTSRHPSLLSSGIEKKKTREEYVPHDNGFGVTRRDFSNIFGTFEGKMTLNDK